MKRSTFLLLLIVCFLGVALTYDRFLEEDTYDSPRFLEEDSEDVEEAPQSFSDSYDTETEEESNTLGFAPWTFFKEKIFDPVYDVVSDVAGQVREHLSDVIINFRNTINNLVDAVQGNQYIKHTASSPWMTVYWNELKGMSLKELLIAGSHDAGCYDMM
jgi:hypothetical protein